ncbi:C1 family peptidase [Deinococcus cellulosilyticus]|uniref:Peptidase C1A papain C-terminal domain-containing protein n=1 Tax=Deinococcus cellulosilyticus (strain DSM 18568 / NBRC 106333 / KACC 11606 / 5516J-15) TaxID=1223518 RepID=A0A511N7N7_DEIC1|nr:C1 family peptidase [Deinococcus cellulosilyticus]GEM48517.1 hypothetical protein DC3_41520 [Deinococcus cellulosilyticus NBRC 106333 = KACC 11606]
MKRLTGLTALLILTACSQTPGGPAPLPGGFSGDLPRGAETVTESEFRSHINDPGAKVFTPEQEQKEKEAAAKQDAANQKAVEDFMAAHPELADLKILIGLSPKPTDTEVQKLPDGNFELSTPDNSKNDLKVITLGKKFKYAEVARSLENFPRQSNQLGMYEMFYPNVPEAYRKRLELPTPESLKNANAQTISSLNLKIGDIYADLVFKIPDPTKPIGWVEKPEDEEGYLDGSDRTNSDASCSAFKDTGIYKNFEWPLKYYATSVKNQGRRGSCVAFAITSATELQHAKKNSEWANLSEQSFYNRIAGHWQPRTYGDGADTTYIYNTSAAEQYKFAYEKEWGYNPSLSRTNIKNAADELIGYSNSCTGYADSYCSNTAAQSKFWCLPLLGQNYCMYLPKIVNPATPSIVPKGQLELWNHEKKDLSIAYMVLTLAFGNTVVASLEVMPSWDNANSNGFAQSRAYDLDSGKGSRGGHAVNITGFITNEKLQSKLPNATPGDGGGYFIVKNSWGACWKDGGYIYIPFDYMKHYGYSAIRVQVD